MPKLRVGLIVDESDQSSFIWDFFNAGRNSDLYSIEALIVQSSFRVQRKNRILGMVDRVRHDGMDKAFAGALFRGTQNLEFKLLARKDERYRAFSRKYPLQLFDVRKLFVSPEISPHGAYRYREKDIVAIQDLQLDILILSGEGILEGAILDTCRFGVISLHCADNSVIRGGPAGFWEVFNREPSTGFTIQISSGAPDGDDVIFRGSTATESLYTRNMFKIFSKSNIFLHKTIERIAVDGGVPQIEPKLPYAYPRYTYPTLAQVLGYIFKTFKYKAAQKFLKVQAKSSNRWSVAYQFVGDWKGAVLGKSTVIENPSNRFLADPFVTVRDGQVVVYVEDYDYRSSRGKISAYKLTRSGHTELGCALEENFHLSYPFLFERDGVLFMCPETHQSRDIRIYKCVEFPLRWELHKILMDDVAAVDTSIFERDGKFWLLTNIDSSPWGDYSSELHIFYSDTLDSSNWISHPGNPVVFDSQKGRNGGLILDGADIYRVFQIQGFDTYGAAMGVAKITELSSGNYREEVVCKILPSFFSRIRGTHTLSYADGILAIDFVKSRSSKD